MNRQNLLILVDSHTKWLNVIETKSVTARATIKELQRSLATYGLPEQ